MNVRGFHVVAFVYIFGACAALAGLSADDPLLFQILTPIAAAICLWAAMWNMLRGYSAR